MQTATATEPAAKLPSTAEQASRSGHTRRGRCRDPLVDRGIDGNSAIGRRIRRTWRAYLQAMGDPQDPISRSHAADAAELAVQVQDLRSRERAGERVGDELVRRTNAFERAERKLRLKSDRHEGSQLATYLAQLAAEPSDEPADGPAEPADASDDEAAP